MSLSPHVVGLSFDVSSPSFVDALRSVYSFQRSFNNSFKDIVRGAQHNMSEVRDIFDDNIKGISTKLKALDALDVRNLRQSGFRFAVGFEKGREAISDTISETLKLRRVLQGIEAQENINYDAVLKTQRLRARIAKGGAVGEQARGELGSLKALMGIKFLQQSRSAGPNSVPLDPSALSQIITDITSNMGHLPDELKVFAKSLGEIDVKGSKESIEAQLVRRFNTVNFQDLLDPMLLALQARLGNVVEINGQGQIRSDAEFSHVTDREKKVTEAAREASRLEKLGNRRDEAISDRVTGTNRELVGGGVSKISDGLKSKDLKSVFGGLGDIFKGAYKDISGRAALSGGAGGGAFSKMFGGLDKVFQQFGGIMKLLGPFLGGFGSIFKLLMDAQAQQKEWNSAILEGASYIDLGAKNGAELNSKLTMVRDSLSQIKFNMKYLTNTKDHLAVINVYTKYGHTFDSLTKGISDVSVGSRELVSRFQGLTQNVLAFATAFGSSFVEIAEAQAKAAEELGMSLAGVQEKFFDIYKSAQMSGFGAKRFYTMVSQLSSQLQGYNVRWSQLGQMVVRFSKVLAPEAAQAFIQKLASFYGDKDILERFKSMTLAGGTPEAGAKMESGLIKNDTANKLEDFIQTGLAGPNADLFTQSLNEAFSKAGFSGINFSRSMERKDFEAIIDKVSSSASREQLAEVASRFITGMGSDRDAINNSQGLKQILNQMMGASGKMSDVIQAMGKMGPGAVLLSHLRQGTPVSEFRGKLPHEIQNMVREMGKRGVALLKAHQVFLETDDKHYQQLAELTASAQSDLKIAIEEAQELFDLRKNNQGESARAKELEASLKTKALGVDAEGNLRESRGERGELGVKIINSVEDMLENDAKFQTLTKDAKQEAIDMAQEQMWATKDISAALDIIIQRIMEIISQLFNIGNFAKGIFGWLSGDDEAKKSAAERTRMVDTLNQQLTGVDTQISHETEVARALIGLEKVIEGTNEGAKQVARKKLSDLGVDASVFTDRRSVREAITKSQDTKQQLETKRSDIKEDIEHVKNSTVGLNDKYLSSEEDPEVVAEKMRLQKQLNSYMKASHAQEFSDEEMTSYKLDEVQTLVKNAQWAQAHPEDLDFNARTLRDSIGYIYDDDWTQAASRTGLRRGDHSLYSLVGSGQDAQTVDLRTALSRNDIATIESLEAELYRRWGDASAAAPSETTSPADAAGTTRADEQVRNRDPITRRVNEAIQALPPDMKDLAANTKNLILLRQLEMNPRFNSLDSNDRVSVLGDILRNVTTNPNTERIRTELLQDFYYANGEIVKLDTNKADRVSSTIASQSSFAGAKPGGFWDLLAKTFGDILHKKNSNSRGGNTIIVNGATDPETTARIVMAALQNSSLA
jgi:hypothetical protein